MNGVWVKLPRIRLMPISLLDGVVVAGAGAVTDWQARLTAGPDTLLNLKLTTVVPSLGFWQAQIDQLQTQQWNRDDRLAEIDLQQSDLHSFLGLAVPIAADTHPWLRVLLSAVQEVAFRVAADMKDIFRTPRPNALVDYLLPPIRTPSHSAFPSGHATEAFAAASVLGALYPRSFMLLRQMACRIALNQGYAGVHFPVDHHAGAVLGDLLGNHIVTRVFGTSLLRNAGSLPYNLAAPLLPLPPPTRLPAVGVSVEDFTLQSHILTNLVARPVPSTAPVAGILPWLAAKVLGDVGTDAP